MSNRNASGPVHRVTPRRWTSWGEAALRLDDGREAVVWQGIPGERARVRPTGRGQHRVHGEWLSSPSPDPRRRTPPCEKATLCGGCPLMHLTVSGQHDARLSMLSAAFKREGLDLEPPSTVVASPDGDEGYRHVVKLAVGRSDRGRLRLGTYARGTHHVVPISGCKVATPTLRRLMATVAHHSLELDLRPWDAETGDGILRHVVLRQSRATGQVLVTLVTGRGGRLPQTLADQLQAASEHIAGVSLHINSEPGNAIFAAPEGEVPRFKRLAGTPVLEEELAGVRLQVGPGDFFQTNPGVADRIARDLVELLAPFRDRPVLDLYCGVGGFTLALAQSHGWAYGAEVVEGAIARARENARLNHLPAEFGVGRVAEIVPELARRTAGQGPVVVVDPARRGLEEGVIESVLSLQPAAVAYLSCNPRALARDLALFTARGWSLSHIAAYDMFPQTAHLETLVMLLPPSPPEVTRRAPRRRVVR